MAQVIALPAESEITTPLQKCNRQDKVALHRRYTPRASCLLRQHNPMQQQLFESAAAALVNIMHCQQQAEGLLYNNAGHLPMASFANSHTAVASCGKIIQLA